MERFSRFIEWPTESNLNSKNTVTFGVLTNNVETLNAFKSFFRTHKIKDKHVKVVRIKELSAIFNVTILYVDKKHNFTIEQILESSKVGILLIGDTSKMVEEGTAISFHLSNNKLKFRINRDVVDSLGFQISSYLLEMADIYPADSVQGGK
jgi:hypothetical protein